MEQLLLAEDMCIVIPVDLRKGFHKPKNQLITFSSRFFSYKMSESNETDIYKTSIFSLCQREADDPKICQQKFGKKVISHYLLNFLVFVDSVHVLP